MVIIELGSEKVQLNRVADRKNGRKRKSKSINKI